METFAKIGFAKISLAAQKIWVASQGEGGGTVAVPWSPDPPARTLMGAITCFFNQTHCSFSQIWYHGDGFVICIIIKCQ